MSQALYRKYRPRTFSDVAGQEHITRTLKNQAAQGRLSHAYIFVGTRGTGKTSCAKIFARAVNCETNFAAGSRVDSGPDKRFAGVDSGSDSRFAEAGGEPCNACTSCAAIESGAAADVLELDAASNNGVDNVRELRDEAVFTPASARYRVYIIDEAHMLSASAFNALLKILEEPPPHVIFILATTEFHKLPATIVSRCQRFSFRRLEQRVIQDRLVSVARSENIELDERAAELLARYADGSMRDGLSLLDQCAAAGDVTEPRVRDILGLVHGDAARNMASAIRARDAKRVFTLFDELYAAGAVVDSLFDELERIMRDALVSNLAPGEAVKLLSGAFDGGELRAFAGGISNDRLLYLLETTAKARAGFTRGAADRVLAEIALASLLSERLSGGTDALVPRIAALEERIERLSVTGAVVSAREEYGTPEPDDGEPPWAEENDDDNPPCTDDEVDDDEPIATTAVSGSADSIRKRIFALNNGALNANLGDADFEVDGGTLSLYIPRGSFAKDLLSADWAVAEIRAAAEAELGHPVKVRVIERDTESAAPPGDDAKNARLNALRNFDIVSFEE